MTDACLTRVGSSLLKVNAALIYFENIAANVAPT